MNRFALLLAPLALLALAGAASGAPPAVAAAPPALSRDLADWYALGGFVMHPLALCWVLVLGIVAERAWALRSAATLPRALARELLCRAGDPEACRGLTAASASALGRIAHAVLEDAGRSAVARHEHIAAVGESELRRLHRNLSALSGLANVSTMLGLLGTVTGMISAFERIAQLGTSSASIVAGGIFEALVTTVAGLVIGITAMACHTHFVRRVEEIALSLEEVVSALLETPAAPAAAPFEERASGSPAAPRLAGAR